MERAQNSDSKTHVEKLNRTSTIDLSFNTLWEIILGHPVLADEIRFERRLLAATFTIAFRFYIKIPSLHLSFAFPMCGLHKAPRVMVIKLVQFGF